MYVRMYVCMHICTHIYTYIYIYWTETIQTPDWAAHPAIHICAETRLEGVWIVSRKHRAQGRHVAIIEESEPWRLQTWDAVKMEVKREVKRKGCHGSHGAELRLNGGLIDANDLIRDCELDNIDPWFKHVVGRVALCAVRHDFFDFLNSFFAKVPSPCKNLSYRRFSKDINQWLSNN